MKIFKYISNLIDSPDPTIIIPFGGYANNHKLHTQARVLEDEGLDSIHSDSVGAEIYRSFKRFETDEKSDMNVKVSWQGQEKILTSDNEGYIYLDCEHGLQLNHKNTLWLPVTYQLLDKNEAVFSITSTVMKPSSSAEFGVISDMDETVLYTGLDSFLKWKVIVNTFFKHSDKRLPIEGVQEFYTKLSGGSNGYVGNPFFYLSNSPWNLYDYLIAFLEKFNFPKGTLLLRDIGIENKKEVSFLEGNKFEKINHILKTYPELPFILIGDSVDLDPDIYIAIAKKFPKRITTIYIRSISNKAKSKRVAQLIETTTHVEVKLINNTYEAHKHALSKGYYSDS